MEPVDGLLALRLSVDEAILLHEALSRAEAMEDLKWVEFAGRDAGVPVFGQPEVVRLPLCAGIRVAGNARFGQPSSVDEHVVSVDLPIMWEPNAPEARLTANDEGEARLRLRPHPDDHDRRLVALVWSGCRATRMDMLNDEAIDGHHLYEAGLRDVLWLGEVRESALIAELERLHRAPPRRRAGRCAELRHWVAPLKECIVEVIASSFRVERGPSL